MIVHNIICLSIRNIQFFKIWWLWLKRWVCYAQLKFELQVGVAGSIVKPHPSNFEKNVYFFMIIKWYYYNFLVILLILELQTCSRSLPSIFWVILDLSHVGLPKHHAKFSLLQQIPIYSYKGGQCVVTLLKTLILLCLVLASQHPSITFNISHSLSK